MNNDERDFLIESNKQADKENPERSATLTKRALILADASSPLILLLAHMKMEMSSEIFKKHLRTIITGFICTFTTNIDDEIQFTEELKKHIIRRANKMSKRDR